MGENQLAANQSAGLEHQFILRVAVSAKETFAADQRTSTRLNHSSWYDYSSVLASTTRPGPSIHYLLYRAFNIVNSSAPASSYSVPQSLHRSVLTSSLASIAMLPQVRLHSAPSEQIQALRALKNEIIGHPLKKETTVALGALDTIVRLSTNKTASRNDGKSHDYTFASRPLSEDEIVRLLSLQVIASIAIGKFFSFNQTHLLILR